MRAFMALAAALVVLVLTVAAALGGPLEDALEAVDAGRYGEAVRLLEPLAEAGDTDAEFALGVLYLQGNGVPQDYARGLELLTRAADRGDARAQFQVGLIYHEGVGTTADPAKGVTFFRKAAEQGYGPAEYGLGYAYLYGDGVAADAQQGFMWFRRAAEDGVTEAAFVAAVLYEQGVGTAPDATEAARLYYRGLGFGDLRALVGIGRLAADDRLTGDAPNKEIASASLSLAQDLLTGDLAAEATELLGKLRASMSQAELAAGAKRYQDALGGSLDDFRKPNICLFVDMLLGDVEQVKEDCRRLAALGMPVAAYTLGWTLPAAEGADWLKLAAASDFPAAELLLGKRLMSGDGMEMDLAAALGWFMVAEPRLLLPDLTENYHEDALRQLKEATARASGEDYRRAVAWAAQWNATHSMRPHPEALRSYEDGLLSLRQHDARAALVLFTRAVTRDPRFAAAFNRRTEAKMLLDDLEGARADAYSALRVAPANKEARFNLGQIDYQEGAYADSIAEFDAFIESGGTYWMPFTLRARSYRALGDYEHALADDNRALELAPSEPQLHMSRGLDYFLAGRFEESAADYHALAGGKPGTPRYAALFEFISLGHAGKDDRAALAKVAAAATDNSWPLAVIQFYLGTLPQPGLMNAAPKPEEKCEARYYIGELKLLAGDTATARTMFARAVETCPREFAEWVRATRQLERLPQ